MITPSGTGWLPRRGKSRMGIKKLEMVARDG